MRPKLFTVVAVAVMSFLLATNPMVGHAAGMITGKQIKNNSITGKDIKDHSVTAKDVSGSIAGPAGPVGPQGPQGTAGASGLVRAWAAVGDAGNVKRSAGGVTVSHPDDGTYCVTAPGIAKTATAPVVSVDYEEDTTAAGPNGEQSFAEVNTGTDPGCPASATIIVYTYNRTYSTANGNLTGTQLTYSDEGFTVLIP